MIFYFLFFWINTDYWKSHTLLFVQLWLCLILVVTPPCRSPLLTPDWEPAQWFRLMTHPAGLSATDWLIWLFGPNLTCSCQHGLEHWNVPGMHLKDWTRGFRIDKLFIHAKDVGLLDESNALYPHCLCICHSVRLNLRRSLCGKINAYQMKPALFSSLLFVWWCFTSGGQCCRACSVAAF